MSAEADQSEVSKWALVVAEAAAALVAVRLDCFFQNEIVAVAVAVVLVSATLVPVQVTVFLAPAHYADPRIKPARAG